MDGIARYGAGGQDTQKYDPVDTEYVEDALGGEVDLMVQCGTWIMHGM